MEYDDMDDIKACEPFKNMSIDWQWFETNFKQSWNKFENCLKIVWNKFEINLKIIRKSIIFAKISFEN